MTYGSQSHAQKVKSRSSDIFCGSYTYQDVMESMLRTIDSLCGRSPLFPSEMGRYSCYLMLKDNHIQIVMRTSVTALNNQTRALQCQVFVESRWDTNDITPMRIFQSPQVNTWYHQELTCSSQGSGYWHANIQHITIQSIIVRRIVLAW